MVEQPIKIHITSRSNIQRAKIHLLCSSSMRRRHNVSGGLISDACQSLYLNYLLIALICVLHKAITYLLRNITLTLSVRPDAKLYFLYCEKLRLQNGGWGNSPSYSSFFVVGIRSVDDL